MAHSLREEILKRMRSKKLSIALLERRAGLSIHSVRNILKGKIKKPSAKSLEAIAEALDCSILDLMNSSSSTNTVPFQRLTKRTEKSTLLKDTELMKSCFKAVTELLKEKDISVSIDDYLDIISATYFYSVRDKSSKPDLKFLKWIIEDYLPELQVVA